MTSDQNNNQDLVTNIEESTNTETEKILCPHCKRTATNGIKCKGICVADSDY